MLKDSRVALALFVAVSSVYFATITGITSSNDGSHYALVRAIVEDKSFEISPYLEFTENQDYAFNGDRNFSDRPPGTAFLSSVPYAISRLLPPPIVQPPSKHDADNLRLIYAVMASALAGAGAVTLCYLVMRSTLEISQGAALIAALALAFGSTYWKYGSVLYSHSSMALIAWGGTYLLLRLNRARVPSATLAFGVGVLLGAAPLFEYTSILFSIICGLMIAVLLGSPFLRGIRSPETRRQWLIPLGALLIGGLIPIVILLAYNTANFGGPLELSTWHVDTSKWPQNENYSSNFATPLGFGMRSMLFYGDNNQGIFLLSPITLLGFIGLPVLWKKSRGLFLIFLPIFLAFLIVFSKSTTFNPLTNDGRYLTSFIGFWFVFVGVGLDWILTRRWKEITRLLGLLLVFGLFWLSVRNQMMHIAFSWNYDLSYVSFRPMATPPEHIAAIFGVVFRNWANLPLLWTVEAIFGGLIWLLWRGVASRSESESTG